MTTHSSQPQVSVIIPTYNGDRHLEAALQSVLAQSYPHYEIIAVDDGSTDGTRDILAAYSSKIRWVSQENQGVAIARNRGVAEAQGDLIAFLDQDDVFFPDKLRVQVKALEADPSLGFVASGWQILDEEGERCSSEVCPWRGLPVLNAKAWLVWKPVFLGAMLFQKATLNAVGGFDPTFQQVPDVDLVLRLVLQGWRSQWTPQVTVGYRQHDANASRNVRQQAQELEFLLDRIFAQDELPAEIRRLESDSRYQSRVWSAWRFYHHGEFKEMAIHLEKAHSVSSLPPSEMILDWIRQFKAYSQEYGRELDVGQLNTQAEWNTTVQQALTPMSYRSLGL